MFNKYPVIYFILFWSVIGLIHFLLQQFYPVTYLSRLKRHNVSIHYFYLSWTVSALTYPFANRSSFLSNADNKNKFLERIIRLYWFVGALVTIVCMLIGLTFMFQSLVHHISKTAYAHTEGSKNDPAHDLLMPRNPFRNFFPLILILIVSTFIHEYGHVLCAQKFGVKTERIAFFFAFVFPGAFVEMRTEDFREASPFVKFFISAAGVWHNILAYGLSFLAAYALSHILLPMAYTTNEGVIILEESSSARNLPIFGDKGLAYNQLITSINSCPVKNIQSWKKCINLIYYNNNDDDVNGGQSLTNFGYCIAQHNFLSTNDTRQCCKDSFKNPYQKDTCFTYLDPIKLNNPNKNDTTVQLCLPLRPIAEKNAICFDNSDCTNTFNSNFPFTTINYEMTDGNPRRNAKNSWAHDFNVVCAKPQMSRIPMSDVTKNIKDQKVKYNVLLHIVAKEISPKEDVVKKIILYETPTPVRELSSLAVSEWVPSYKFRNGHLFRFLLGVPGFLFNSIVLFANVNLTLALINAIPCIALLDGKIIVESLGMLAKQKVNSGPGSKPIHSSVVSLDNFERIENTDYKNSITDPLLALENNPPLTPSKRNKIFLRPNYIMTNKLWQPKSFNTTIDLIVLFAKIVGTVILLINIILTFKGV